MTYRTILVDDELPICAELEYLFQAHQDFTVVAKFNVAQKALDYLASHPCALVLLALHMPGLNGLEFARCVGELKLPVFVVFVTAYEKYAVDAFSTPAIGYITKPVSQLALTRTLVKVKGLLDAVRRQSAPELPDAPAAADRTDSGDKLTVSRDGKLYPVTKSEITLAYVRNKEVFVRTGKGDFYAQLTLQEMAAFLDGPPFLQVHRQYIVNLDCVEEIVPWFNGAYLLHLKGQDDMNIPISRNHLQEVRRRLGFR